MATSGCAASHLDCTTLNRLSSSHCAVAAPPWPSYTPANATGDPAAAEASSKTCAARFVWGSVDDVRVGGGGARRQTATFRPSARGLPLHKSTRGVDWDGWACCPHLREEAVLVDLAHGAAHGVAANLLHSHGLGRRRAAGRARVRDVALERARRGRAQRSAG